MTTVQNVCAAVEAGASTVACVVDIFVKLRDSFKISEETRRQSEQCQDEIERLTFKEFHDSCSCKSVKEIPLEKFEEFVERLQKRLGLPEEVKGSLLDGLYGTENEEKLSDFQFKDGQGKIHHGRFITQKKNGKMDIAYAIYTLSFELTEKETEHASYDWWLYVVPVWNVTYTKEARKLNASEKDVFSQWCQVKLYNRVAQECLTEEKTELNEMNS